MQKKYLISKVLDAKNEKIWSISNFLRHVKIVHSSQKRQQQQQPVQKIRKYRRIINDDDEISKEPVEQGNSDGDNEEIEAENQ